MLALTVLTLAADQISKIIVRTTITPGETIEMLGGYFNLTNIENEGAFLGLGDTWPATVRLVVLTIIPVVLIVFAMVYLFTSTRNTRLGQIGACLLIGGGSGNLFDRIVYGSVTDFFHMDFIIFQTGIFNVGDMAILTGAAMMLWSSLRSKGPADQHGAGSALPQPEHDAGSNSDSDL